jgi:hypothetical protein
MPLVAQEPARPQLALMGTVPIYWGEAEGLEGLLDTSETGHWARTVLEREFELVPLDYLSADALAPHSTLMMAQPRALSAEENVALDAWVRGGGHLLLFADPMMTGHSHYGLGDRRRPQDVALLSPILAHWGLELRFDAEQESGLRLVDGSGAQFAVNLAGFWKQTGHHCELAREEIVALCEIGDGVAVLIADAAALDMDGPHASAKDFLAGFVSIFASYGENAGRSGEITGEPRSGGGIPPVATVPDASNSGESSR